MALESWESGQGNLNAPPFVRGTFCERLRVACTEVLAAELMKVSWLWDLNERKVEVVLSSGLWSSRSEGWPDITGT